jgi:23S rRNA pseudouridine955/2504/2580 synthase
MKEIIVTNSSNIFNYIKDSFPNLSTNALHKAFRNKDIRVNNVKTNNEKLDIKKNDLIQIYIEDNTLYGFPKELTTVYEDENVLIVYKPQGLLSNEEHGNDEPTYEDYVKKVKGENIQICHRLDRNTAGLLVFGKNQEAYEELLDAFKLGYIYKEYYTYVVGSDINPQKQHLENYLFKDEKTGFSKVYDTKTKGSVQIVTDIEVDTVYKKLNYTTLKVTIHTGKTHQIRALMAHINHPIIGDSKYGRNEVNKKFKKYKQMLYAVKYTFKFPKESTLSYLNDKTIKLDDSFYLGKIEGTK